MTKADHRLQGVSPAASDRDVANQVMAHLDAPRVHHRVQVTASSIDSRHYQFHAEVKSGQDGIQPARLPR